jgi:Flp pilus assembly protein TadB
MSAQRRLVLAGGIVGGIAVAAITGWVLALLVVPVAAVGLPWLLSSPRPDIAQLEALQEWTRALAGVMGEGQGLEQAIPATLRSTPEAVQPQVRRLVYRLRAGWTTPDALRAFGDEIGTTTGDLVVSKLILASRRRGDGLVQALRDVAASAASDVAARRRIEADRAKPRSNARFVTLVSAGTLAFLSLGGTDYMAPYRTPFGQLLLALLLAAYIGILIWMRQMAAGRPEPRFLVQGTTSGSVQR